MALVTILIDDSTRKRKAIAYPGFLDTVTVNGGAATPNFTISGVTIDSSHAIDAYVDGRLQVVTTNYTIDTGNNRIIFTSSVNTGSTVRIRVHLK